MFSRRRCMQYRLNPTRYINSDDPHVQNFARTACIGAKTHTEKAVRLYYAVRDGIRYNPYAISLDPDAYRASFVLERKEGFCVQKAILLAAVSRAAGIPARLRFANVVNHLVTGRLKKQMKTGLFVFHGITEFFLDGEWRKATPAFNLSLCEKFGVLPLEFDGVSDSVFHPFDREGRRHMEYVYDYGPFDDFPFERMVSELKKHYPHFFPDAGEAQEMPTGNFEDEAAAESAT